MCNVVALAVAALLMALPAWADETAHGDPAGHAEEGHSASIMNVDPGLMIWTVVTFVLLLVVLRLTAWKPLVGALQAREERIRGSIADADRIKREAEDVMAQYKKMMNEAKVEAQHIVDEGKADAEKVRQSIIEDTRREAEESKQRARREIELATDEAKKQLWEESSRLSTLLAEKILQRNLDAADQERLIEQFLDEYRSQNAAG
jgi:F-type H+-transporting ATPase subunit b